MIGAQKNFLRAAPRRFAFAILKPKYFIVALISLFSVPSLAADLSEIEAHKKELVELGVPDNDYVLEYLVHEIFYNTPYRDQVATSIDKVKVLDIKLPIGPYDASIFSSLFKKIKFDNFSEKINHVPFKCIKISGHNSYFCWSPTEPDANFIFKNRHVGSYASAVTALLYSVWVSDSRVFIDFPIESMLNFTESQAQEASNVSTITIKPYPNIRFTTTYRMRQDNYVYPLHGFLNSPKLSEAAEKAGLSEFEWIRKKLMPRVAQTVFAFQNQAGIHLSHHTQNLWIVYNQKTGRFHLAAKDFSDGYFNPLVAYKRINKWAASLPKGHFEHFYHALWRINNYTYGENPRAQEPSFNFMSYGYQSIAMGRKYTFKEEAALFRSFFSIYFIYIKEFYGVPFEMSVDLKSRWDRLDEFSHDYDLRLSISDGKTMTGKIIGLQAFGELLMREALAHINKVLIGPRTYPRSRNAQDSLDAIYRHQAEYGVDVCYLKPRNIIPLAEIPDPKSRGERAQNLWNKVLNPLWVSKCWIEDRIKGTSINYEYTARHILRVDSKTGEVLSLIPRPKWFNPEHLEGHVPLCQQIIMATAQSTER